MKLFNHPKKFQLQYEILLQIPKILNVQLIFYNFKKVTRN